MNIYTVIHIHIYFSIYTLVNKIKGLMISSLLHTKLFGGEFWSGCNQIHCCCFLNLERWCFAYRRHFFTAEAISENYIGLQKVSQSGGFWEKKYDVAWTLNWVMPVPAGMKTEKGEFCPPKSPSFSSVLAFGKRSSLECNSVLWTNGQAQCGSFHS